MPQMSPMLWFSLYIYFIMIFMLIMVMFYYLLLFIMMDMKLETYKNKNLFKLWW